MTPRVEGPHKYVLPQGTILYRVHRRYRAPVEFNTSVADATSRGGRFDSTSQERFPYYYAASSVRAALLEVFLDEHEYPRDLVPRSAVRDRIVSAVRLTVDAAVAALVDERDFEAVGQSEDLVTMDRTHYAETRQWVKSLRRSAPWAQGVIWRPLRDNGARSVILFGDRFDDNPLRTETAYSRNLDDDDNFRWLLDQLSEAQSDPR